MNSNAVPTTSPQPLFLIRFRYALTLRPLLPKGDDGLHRPSLMAADYPNLCRFNSGCLDHLHRHCDCQSSIRFQRCIRSLQQPLHGHRRLAHSSS
jgi:hypothetical protein